MITEMQLYMDMMTARCRADELDRTAARLIMLAKVTLPSQIRIIDSNWNGTASTAFIAKGDHICRELDERATELRKCAETIRTIAARVYNSEMKALEISKTRSYK